MSVQNFTAAASGEVPEIVSRRRKIFHAHFRSPIMDVTLPILRYILTWKCSSECWLSTGTNPRAIAAWEVRQKCPRNTKIFQKKKPPPKETALPEVIPGPIWKNQKRQVVAQNPGWGLAAVRIELAGGLCPQKRDGAHLYSGSIQTQ